MIDSDWWGLYGGSLKAWLVPAAYTHPAKFSRKLIDRIYAHALEEGWLTPGQRVLDPMAGVATGAIPAANAGLRWEGVELEGHFIEAGRATLEKHRRVWERMGKPVPVLRQGDARQLQGQADAIVSSPPYADAINAKGDGIDWSKVGPATGRKRGPGTKQYETLKAQESYSAIVSSPPFGEQSHYQQYGGEKGKWGGDSLRRVKKDYVAGLTPGQLGALPVGDVQAVITSPPYAHSMHGGGGIDPSKLVGNPPGPHSQALGPGAAESADSVAIPENYWAAMRQVYANCFALLPPGGHIILVLKAFVRDGNIVDLPGQTCQLLEAVGFQVLHRHRAWLIAKEAQARLDGGEDRRAFKSFFRRIHERRGAPAIDFEEVICAVRADVHLV